MPRYPLVIFHTMLYPFQVSVSVFHTLCPSHTQRLSDLQLISRLPWIVIPKTCEFWRA